MKSALAANYSAASSLEVLRPSIFLIWFFNRMLCPFYILDPILWSDQPIFLCIQTYVLDFNKHFRTWLRCVNIIYNIEVLWIWSLACKILRSKVLIQSSNWLPWVDVILACYKGTLSPIHLLFRKHHGDGRSHWANIWASPCLIGWQVLTTEADPISLFTAVNYKFS